ncbi:hypothetical protein T484DRAFT_1756349 [Baffinella frigidus]|nr:hypothetical protein T484DRAFT_1756349 [Cryptophyta sp. CCMP2293]
MSVSTSNAAVTPTITTEGGATVDSGFRTVSRVLHMTVSGTLQGCDEKGATAGMWRPKEGKTCQVFAPTEYGIDNNHETATNALHNARVKSVVCTEYTSTFPIPLGIKCDALPACESTDIGHRYIMTTLPCHKNTTPQHLYSADDTSAEAVRWKQEYPQYTARNIDTHNVMEVKSHPVVFVDLNHPVISLLRANKEILGSDIDEQSLVQGRWHTVSRQCFNTACKTLRSKVLSNINTVNLTNFALQAVPLDRKAWCDIGKGEHVKDIVNATTRESLQDAHTRALNKPYNVSARFQINYEYPTHTPTK